MAQDTDADGDITLDHNEEDIDHGDEIGEDMDQKYPNRPINAHLTLPFHELIEYLFKPLLDIRKPNGPMINRKKQGPHGQSKSPHEVRESVIKKFIGRWRSHVGEDIFPAFRLIMPDKDRDRAMYGLKEKTIGKLLVRVMKIDKNSEDAFNLLNWKLPGFKASSTMAGDFAGRCFEVLQKRPLRTSYGDMTVAEVNDKLDELSAAQKEENQLPLFEEFYRKMSPIEMQWLIRMILRQIKIGASEKTILHTWHPDAENLFNISSSLRRVCWELYDPKVSLEGDDTNIALMQCFQPQLAAFQMRSLDIMIKKMRLVDEEDHFWIEEKLDGERMQLHMIEDASVKGGKRFAFWSRKAKDYTYLYGSGLEDDNSALTRHLKGAFHEGVRNIILDGEMITWDPEKDKIVGFGTLKTAALSEQANPYGQLGERPLFRVFDCLYLNDKALTDYTLQDRYAALTSSVTDVHRRLEVHKHTEARTTDVVERLLKDIIAEQSEGLVLKNPRSMYRLNSRNDDWIKVKPEYMTGFGDNLDCVVIGGYYGSGHRGGGLSSFLCGLRVTQNEVQVHGADPSKCYSFFKVGGGFTASDYADIRHLTDGKWHDWDRSNPPTRYMELGGGDLQYERPDVWIKPEESFVVEVKAASVHKTDQFRTTYTLRFPRFKRIRRDKDWKTALSTTDFWELKNCVEEEEQEKKFEVDESRRKRNASKRVKRDVVVAGQDKDVAAFAGPSTKLFQGLSFYIMSEQTKPKKSKAELEQLVKAHGGSIVQTDKDEKTICISDRNVVKAAALKKTGKRTVTRPSWLYACIRQAELDLGDDLFVLPLEPSDILFGPPEDIDRANRNVDQYGDSYFRDPTFDELRKIVDAMPKVEYDAADIATMRGLLDIA